MGMLPAALDRLGQEVNLADDGFWNRVQRRRRARARRRATATVGSVAIAICIAVAGLALTGRSKPTLNVATVPMPTTTRASTPQTRAPAFADLAVCPVVRRRRNPCCLDLDSLSIFVP